MKKFLLFVSLLSLIACTPQARLSRILKNHPELVRTDTISSIDTTTKPGVRIDTVLWMMPYPVPGKRDTFLLKKDSLVVRFIRIQDTANHREGFQVTAQGPPVTTINKKESTSQTATLQESLWHKIRRWLVMAGLILWTGFLVKKTFFS
ncbi:MAG: hypothetical protein WCO63_01390 [Bacteroidota bacterium]